jgi:sugar lactone lactonase YvrE
MDRIFILLALFLTAACGSEKEGMILFVDPAYTASVVATSADGFSAPDGLLRGSRGFYLADEGDGTIRLWNGPGKVSILANRRKGIETPEDLVLDGQGTLYFTDDKAGGLWRISPDGAVGRVARPEKGLRSTEGIALSPTGQIIVGDGKAHTLFSVSPSGEVKTLLGPDAAIGKPESLAFDGEGNLLIADNVDDIVYLLTPDRRLRRLISGVANFSPEGIAWHDGALFITDSRHGRLWRYTAEKGLETIAVFGGKLSHVSGVTVEDDDRLYLTIQDSLDPGHAYLLRLEKVSAVPGRN